MTGLSGAVGARPARRRRVRHQHCAAGGHPEPPGRGRPDHGTWLPRMLGRAWSAWLCCAAIRAEPS